MLVEEVKPFGSSRHHLIINLNLKPLNPNPKPQTLTPTLTLTGVRERAPRVIIDYVQTKETRRGRRHANRLVDHMKALAEAASADMYVLSTEEAASYWLRLGFILEQDCRSPSDLFFRTYLIYL